MLSLNGLMQIKIEMHVYDIYRGTQRLLLVVYIFIKLVCNNSPG